MSEQGPVCHVPPVNIPANPQVHDLPGIGSPAQPNLMSILNTLNDLQRAVRILAGQLRPINPSKGGSNGFNTKQDKPKDKGRWIEEARVTEKVRVFNPQDHEQYVDVEQINSLTMKDPVTKEIWKWDRDRS